MPVSRLQLGSGNGDMTAKISYSARDYRLIEFYDRYYHVIKDVYVLRTKSSYAEKSFALLDDHRVEFNKNAVRWYSAPD